MGENPSSLLNLPNGLLFSGGAVVKSLTCDNLDLKDAACTPFAPVGKEMMRPFLLDLEVSNLVPFCAPVLPSPTPTCTPWLLTGLLLMGLNAYFPQLLSKLQAQPASKVPTKQVCDPQSNYPVTQSQTRRSTQISKSINMNR
ncbi:hypothetical protein DSO57_1025508 [Entomophthora muscae]|uniref:Uncharacterized protein n=1 Tax=Entomophthora muscae TaxID=34485 RepID=A0ACC2T2C5_9FUNG|nr:hypothetical protein DSO57_1025508 [Entomophthora muscae]